MVDDYMVFDPTANRYPPVVFEYVNWRGDRHEYKVLVESIAFGMYPTNEVNNDVQPTSSVKNEEKFVMHAHVITRDGDPRPDMGPSRRRTFDLLKVENLRRSDRKV